MNEGKSLDDSEAVEEWGRGMGGRRNESRGFLWSRIICIKSQSGMQAGPWLHPSLFLRYYYGPF